MAGFSSCSKINLFIEEDKSVSEHLLTILLFCHDEQLEFVDLLDFLCLFTMFTIFFTCSFTNRTCQPIRVYLCEHPLIGVAAIIPRSL